MSTHGPSVSNAAFAGQRQRLTAGQLAIAAILLAMAISALSLTVTAATDYDPMGWIVYAREAFGHGVLDTNTYPSWKPLPVLLIGPFTLFFHGFADVYWWLWIDRTLGILAVFGGAGAGYRLAGRWGALTVGVTVLLSAWWFEDTTIGRDGPADAGLMMIALLAYYRNWPRLTGVCIACVAMLRPEVAPFLVLYGAWAWWTKHVTIYEVVLVIAFVAVMWEIPTLLHAGKSAGALASSGAGAATPVHARVPFLAVLKDSVIEMRPAPAAFCLLAALSTLWGLIPRGRGSRFASIWGRNDHERVLIAYAACFVLIIACETQFLHFSGNERYQIPGLIIWCVIAGVAAVRAGSLLKLRGSHAWGVALAVAVILVPTIARAYGVEHDSYRLIKQRQGQLNSINAELKQSDCPGYKWTDNHNNAYLAVITGQSLPASIVPATVPARKVNGQYYFVYCAPAAWKPSGRA